MKMTVSVRILYKVALAFLPITLSESDWGQGALNITGYSTDLFDCLVVASRARRPWFDPHCNQPKYFVI